MDKVLKVYVYRYTMGRTVNDKCQFSLKECLEKWNPKYAKETRVVVSKWKKITEIKQSGRVNKEG